MAKYFCKTFKNILTFTHRKQNIWPHGKRAGCIQVCKQMGHSKIFPVLELLPLLLLVVAAEEFEVEGFWSSGEESKKIIKF